MNQYFFFSVCLAAVIFGFVVVDGSVKQCYHCWNANCTDIRPQNCSGNSICASGSYDYENKTIKLAGCLPESNTTCNDYIKKLPAEYLNTKCTTCNTDLCNSSTTIHLSVFAVLSVITSQLVSRFFVR